MAHTNKSMRSNQNAWVATGKEGNRICTIGESPNRCACVWVCIGAGTKRGTKEQVMTKAMVDSGNFTTRGVMMSERFFNKCGLQYESWLKGSIKMAAKNQKIEQKGITRQFTMKMEGVPDHFRVRALVLHGLSDEINIGCAFLQ